MKTPQRSKSMFLLFALSLAWTLSPLAMADPDTATPSAKSHRPDHRSDDRSPTTETSRDTIKVTVFKHSEFQDGKYVWIPTYTADAPRPKSADAKVYWVPPGFVHGETGYQPGHWSMTAGIEAIPAGNSD